MESAAKHKRRGRLGRVLVLGGVVAVVTKPELRSRLLDAVFGPEEQFEYDSVTEPVTAGLESDEAAVPSHRDSEDPSAELEQDEGEEEVSWMPTLHSDALPSALIADDAPPSGDEAEAVADDPSASGLETAAEEDAPATAYDPPASIYDTPASAHDAPALSYEPTASVYEPPASAYEPPASVDEPPASGDDPAASSYEPPASSYDAPASGYEPPASSYDAPASAYEPCGLGVLSKPPAFVVTTHRPRA